MGSFFDAVGVFFHHLLEGLKGKAKNADGDVTFRSLCDYVQGRVSRDVPKVIGNDIKQSPNMKADLSGASPVLMTAAAHVPPIDTTSITPKVTPKIDPMPFKPMPGDPTTIDGIFGPETRRAIMRYESDHDLNVTGRLNMDVLHALGLPRVASN